MNKIYYTYTIHDTSSYGIYNGFGCAVEDLIHVISRQIFRVNGIALDYTRIIDVDEIMRALREEYVDMAQEIYEPYPAGRGWKESALADYNEQVANRTAAGKAQIPAENVVKSIAKIIANEISNKTPEMIGAMERRLASYSGMSDAKAREWEKQYNLTMNEGGYGFVPHVVGSEEAEKLKKEIEAYKSLLENLDNIKIDDTNLID